MKILKSTFPDYRSIYDLYRSTYKYTPCGPWVGIAIESEELVGYGMDGEPRYSTVERSIFCDDLRELGTFDDMAESGVDVVCINVGSIVEGSDVEIEADPIRIDPDDTPSDISRQFYEAVEWVNGEACAAWDEANA